MSSRSPRGSERRRREARSGRWPRDRGDQAPDAPVLVGRHLGEVLVAQQLVAGGAELERIALLVVRLAARAVGERLADLLLRERALGRSCTGGSTGARRNQATKARSNSSSSSCRETSVCRSVK